MDRCQAPGCDRPLKKTGLLCSKHYQQERRRNGNFTRCRLDDCQQEAYTNALCKTHYRHWKDSGDPYQEPVRKPHPMKPCLVPDCLYETSAIQGSGLCRLHCERLYLGLDLFLPITPGKRGRKPYVPNIPDDVRAAASRASYCYARGEPPTPADRALAREYRRSVIAWRMSERPRDEQLAQLQSRF